MPIVDRGTLLIFDGVFQAAGTAIAIAALISLIRSGRWRNPLADQPAPMGEPDALLPAAVMFVYFGLAGSVITFIRNSGMPLEPVGSKGWLLISLADTVAKLLLCFPMAWVLMRNPLHAAAPPPFPRAMRLGIATGLAAVPVCMGLLFCILHIWKFFSPNLHEPIHPVIEALSQPGGNSAMKIQLTLAAVIAAPLAEELFFRGVLMQFFVRASGSDWVGISITALAFGLIHGTQPQDVLPLFALGALLGYVRIRYRSLTACVIAHALFNSRTIGLLLLNPEAARQLYP